MSVTVGHDAIHLNVGRLPHGQTAGYTTGSAAIKWTAADWAAHPEGVRICQDSGTDHTADVLDVETGAATNGEAAAWFKAAEKAFQAATRPGQRAPAVYTSAGNVTPLVDALIAGGVKTGVALWVANWNLSDAQATADVLAAAGPFPIIGIQFHSGAFYDTSVFSTSWLSTVAEAPVTSGAPFRHLTQAGDTVASLAAGRGMKPGAWLEEQDKLGADTAVLAANPLPPGLTWLSVSP